jgi:hypothetical protein
MSAIPFARPFAWSLAGSFHLQRGKFRSEIVSDCTALREFFR